MFEEEPTIDPSPGRDGLALHGLVAQDSTLELLSDVSTWAEGPAWIPESQTLRWSDIKGNRILQWSWATAQTDVYAHEVEFTNGRIVDRDGSVVQCSHGRRRVERDRDGVVTALVESWQGRRLNSPNDVVIAPDGAIWFTDPDYGITEPLEGHPGELEYGDHWIFRIDPASGEAEPMVKDSVRPNGLAFSPSGDVLYVADSGVDAWVIRSYDVEVDESGIRCSEPRIFATPRPGSPDGIRVDVAGNVWSSCGAGVRVYAPDGLELGSIEVPEVTANLCFGGPDGTTLFMTATTGLYRIATLTRDAHLTAPRS